MSVIEKDMSKFDTIAILQLVWAMNKADSYGEKFPNFEKWLAALECVDFSDSAFLTAALEEAQEGFFRKAQGLGKSK
jgi:hypothetical protein